MSIRPIYRTSLLSIEQNRTIEEKTLELRKLKRQSAENIIAMGGLLIEIKEMLPKGQFKDYLGYEFADEYGYSERAAQLFMNAHRTFAGKKVTDSLSLSVMYLVSAPSTPDDVKAKAIERIEAGEKISLDRAKEMIAESRSQASQVTIDINAIEVVDEAEDEIEEEAEEESINRFACPEPPRYTLPLYLLDALNQLSLGWNVDCCRSTCYPNIKADTSYSELDGLDPEWIATSAFLAVPAKEPWKWVNKFLSSQITVGVVLTDIAVERPWFAELAHTASAFCFLRSSPQVVFYIGSSSKNFIKVFSPYGLVCRSEV